MMNRIFQTISLAALLALASGCATTDKVRNPSSADKDREVEDAGTQTKLAGTITARDLTSRAITAAMKTFPANTVIYRVDFGYRDEDQVEVFVEHAILPDMKKCYRQGVFVDIANHASWSGPNIACTLTKK